MSEEVICKNCKYHYKEEIAFDYPQSCCAKRKAVIEEWFNCDNFEYSDRYIKQLQQENKQLKLINKEYERLNKENGRGFKITSIKQYNIEELVRCKDNWKKLKGYIKDNLYFYSVFQGEDLEIEIAIQDVLNKMKELEQGSDSNEQ